MPNATPLVMAGSLKFLIAQSIVRLVKLHFVYPIDISRLMNYLCLITEDIIRSDADGTGSSIPEQSKPSYPLAKGSSFAC